MPLARPQSLKPSAPSLLATLALLVAIAACEVSGHERSPAGSPPLRIVSLTLAGDELLPALVPMDRIAAVTHLADDPRYSGVRSLYPDRVVRIPADFERIAACEPDLVIVASYVSREAREPLLRSGIPIFEQPAVESFDDLFAGIHALSARLGCAEVGRDLVTELEGRLRRVEEDRPQAASRPRVLIWTGGFCHGRRTSAGAILAAAGGRNALDAIDVEGFRGLPEERLLALDFDAMLLEGETGEDLGGQLPPALRARVESRGSRLLALPSRLFSSVSQHMVDAVESLAPALRGEEAGGQNR